MDIAIIILVLVCGVWTEWRMRQLGRSESGPLFVCYYCGHMYPVFRRERIGNYDYCPEHGQKRKARHTTSIRKEIVIYDDRVRVHTAEPRSEHPNNDPLPWAN